MDTSKPLPLYGADTTKAQHDSVTHTPTHGVDIDQSSHGSVTHSDGIYSYVSQSYIDRLISRAIGPHRGEGMSFLRFVTIMVVGTIALPLALIVYALAYICSMTTGIFTIVDRRLWGSDIVEADKDMVTKDKSHIQECQYCDSPNHVTKNCPHRNVNWPETGVTQ